MDLNPPSSAATNEEVAHSVEQTRREIATIFAPPPTPIEQPAAEHIASIQSALPEAIPERFTPPILPPISAPNPNAAPIVTAPPALSFDEEDDDLPRPGKVWDNSGDDLATMLKNRNASPPAPEAKLEPEAAFTNIEPVAPQSVDVGAAWAQVLESLKDQAGLYGILTHARLAEVRDEQVVVRIASGFGGLLKMLEVPAKRDALSNSLNNVLGKRLGVKFEIDAAPPAGTEPVAHSAPGASVNRGAGILASPASAQSATPARRPAERPAPAPMPEQVGPPAIKITPELLETMRQDPLIAAVMDRLGGQPVKIE